MLLVMLTVACYTASSLGDKYISAKLKCTPAEFAFIVSFATTVWIGAAIPFSGWGFEGNLKNIILLFFLAAWKIMEFYTSAILLKTVSVYELKAWLGMNLVSSYICNVIRGIYGFHVLVLLFGALLLVGITLTVKGQEYRSAKKIICLCIFYIVAKFFYGMMFGMMSPGCETTSVLFIVMIITALVQLPKINLKKVFVKRGIVTAAATRIPNAAGLIFEAAAAVENVFLYAMIQPVQLAVLFVISLIKKEPMGRQKLAGSLICIFAVCAITVLVSG